MTFGSVAIKMKSEEPWANPTFRPQQLIPNFILTTQHAIRNLIVALPASLLYLWYSIPATSPN